MDCRYFSLTFLWCHWQFLPACEFLISFFFTFWVHLFFLMTNKRKRMLSFFYIYAILLWMLDVNTENKFIWLLCSYVLLKCWSVSWSLVRFYYFICLGDCRFFRNLQLMFIFRTSQMSYSISNWIFSDVILLHCQKWGIMVERSSAYWSPYMLNFCGWKRKMKETKSVFQTKFENKLPMQW